MQCETLGCDCVVDLAYYFKVPWLLGFCMFGRIGLLALAWEASEHPPTQDGMCGNCPHAGLWHVVLVKGRLLSHCLSHCLFTADSPTSMLFTAYSLPIYCLFTTLGGSNGDIQSPSGRGKKRTREELFKDE
jgi:hypothetical protein